MTNAGRLYILATPLGHLGDFTFRGVEVLKEAKLAAAEDTRRTRKLLAHYGLKTPLISYREENHKKALPIILRTLEEGAAAALVTDAGTPGISDPGALLVKEAVARGHHIVPIPGPSAAACALSVSGLPADAYLFAGFLPSRKKARRDLLEDIKSQHRTLVFFEAPHRLLESLEDMAEILGPRQAVVGREMTKMNEEFIRGRFDEILDRLRDRREEVRGEITIVAAGEDADRAPKLTAEEIMALIKGDQRPVKEIVAELSKSTSLNRSELYRLILKAQGRDFEK